MITQKMNTRKTRVMRRGGRSQRPRAATERGGTREAATHAKTVTPAGTRNTGLHG